MSCWRVLAPIATAALVAACVSPPSEPRLENPEELRGLHAAAQSAYKSNDFSLAQSLYEKIVDKADVDAETWFMLGNLYARKGEHERAVWAYKNCLRLNSQDARAWNNLSVINLKDAWEAAHAARRFSLSEDPANASSAKIIEVLNELDFLPSTSPPRGSKSGAISGNSLAQSPKPGAVTLPTQANTAFAVMAQPKVEAPILNAVPGPLPARSTVIHLPASVAPLMGDTERSPDVAQTQAPGAGDKTIVAQGALAPASVAGTAFPSKAIPMPTEADFLAYARRHGISLKNVIGTKRNHIAGSVYIKASEKLNVIVRNVSGGAPQNLTLLKGATMRVPLSEGGLFRFESKVAPRVVYQDTMIPGDEVLRSWFRFSPARAL